MASSTTNNFQQLRWQNIRLVEGNQVLETENRVLREKIKDIDATKQSSISFVLKGVKKWMLEAREELNIIKNSYSIEKHAILGDVASQREHLLKLQAMLIAADEEREQFKLEKSAIEAHATALGEQLRDLSDKHSAEMEALHERIASINILEQQLEDTQAQAAAHENKSISLATQLAASRAEFNTHCVAAEEALNEKDKLIGVLRDDIAHLQMEREREGKVWEDEQADMTMRHDHEVERLREEITHLQGKLEDQEDYIEKLTKMLMGNKTNFAKFIDLKTENAQLQSQIAKGGAQKVAFKKGAPKGAASGRRRPQPHPLQPQSAQQQQQLQQQQHRVQPTGFLNELDVPGPPIMSGRSAISLDVVDPGIATSTRTTPRQGHVLNREASDEELRILQGYAHSTMNSPPPRAAPPPAVPKGASKHAAFASLSLPGSTSGYVASRR